MFLMKIQLPWSVSVHKYRDDVDSPPPHTPIPVPCTAGTTAPHAPAHCRHCAHRDTRAHHQLAPAQPDPPTYQTRLLDAFCRCFLRSSMPYSAISKLIAVSNSKFAVVHQTFTDHREKLRRKGCFQQHHANWKIVNSLSTKNRLCPLTLFSRLEDRVRREKTIFNLRNFKNTCVSKLFCKFYLSSETDSLTVELEKFSEFFELSIYYRACQQCTYFDIISADYESENYILEIPAHGSPITGFK